MQIIKPLLCFGAIPYKCTEYIDATSTEMVRRVVRKMGKQGENILEVTTNPSRKKYIRFSFRFSNEEIIKCFPKEYIEIYRTNEVKAMKDKATQAAYCDRVISVADAAIFAHCSGARAYQPERGTLRECKEQGNLKGCYFTSAEVRKSLNSYSDSVTVDSKGNRTVMGSKMAGVYIAPSGCFYMVYSIGTKHIAWDFSEEKMYRELVAYLSEEDRTIRYDGMIFLHEKDNAAKNIADTTTNRIMIRKDGTKLLTRVLRYVKKQRNLKSKLSMDNWTYKNAYFIPQSREGIEMLKIMSRPKWKEEILAYFLNITAVYERDSTCDAKIYNEENKSYIYIEIFCIPDLAQFYRFYSRFLAQTRNKNESVADSADIFAVRCFDFQEYFVRSMMAGENVSIISSSFQEFLKTLEYNEMP